MERITLASLVAQALLLDPGADLIDQDRSEPYDMERIQDRDGVGQFTTDRVETINTGLKAA